MAMYSRGLLVFGLGMLLVSLWCMKATEASGDHGSDSGAKIHLKRREDPPAGCHSKHSDAGEECTDEDDSLGLYSDVDDTFKSAMKKVAGRVSHHAHEVFGDNDDSPDIAHNNVDVLGH